MHKEGVARLVAETVAHRYSRRDVLRRGAALGLAAPAIAIALDAQQAMAQTPANTNPLGVDPAAPLDVVIFKGGYGDDYAIYVKDQMYQTLYPESEITYAGIQRLGEQLQPRFVAGEPPDIIDNSGAGNLDTTALIAEEQLADLADLMAAQSYDTEGAAFADTLVPGTQVTGNFDGTQYYLNLALSAYGLWYSSTWMADNGFTYPTTWTDFIALCEEIKAMGVAPFMTTGVHPQYIRGFVFDQMLWKHDPQAIVNIDNLEADAWKAPAVTEVLEALMQLAEGDFFGAGWDGLDHTQSQAEWLQGKAVFLPCGTWLENEMKDQIPEGFDMVIAPTPSLDGDQIPFEGILAGAGEPFMVPAQGKNVQGGKEYLRLLFSREGGRAFSEATRSLTVVQGSADDLDLGTAFTSTQEAIAAAGENTFQGRYSGWYDLLDEDSKLLMLEMIQGQLSIEEFQEQVQEVADTVKEDESVIKYQREWP